MGAPERTKPYGKSEIGDRLFLARRELKRTQDQFAAECHIGRVNYRNLEAGQRGLSTAATLRKVAEGFSVPVETLQAYLDGRLALKPFLALRGKGHKLNELQLRRIEERRADLGVERDVVTNLVSDAGLGADMKTLPEQIRRAVIGFAHVYNNVPVEKVLVVAKELLADHGDRGPDRDKAAYWYELLRGRLSSYAESHTRLTPKHIKIGSQEEL